MNAACAMPASSRRSRGMRVSVAPFWTTVSALSPSRNVDAATRAGGRGSRTATRPSTVTVVPSCNPMRSMTASPSGLYGRTANASDTGTGLRFSTSTTTSSSSPPDRNAYARCTAWPPGTRIDVSTTGAAPSKLWRTRDAGARDGRCQPSSAPIHQSSDQPSNHVVTSPRGSTIASHGEATLPTSVQLRAVTLVRKGRWPRGWNAGEAGSSWRSSQYGQTQSGPICAAARVRRARNTVRAPIGSSSPGDSTSNVSPRRWNVERWRTMSSSMRSRPIARRTSHVRNRLMVMPSPREVLMARRRARDQPPVCVHGRATLVHHPHDLSRDRHLDSVGGRQLEHGPAALHAFGDLVHLGEDLVDRAALPQLLADVAVARPGADAGGGEVAHPGVAGGGHRLPTERDAEPCHLGETAGHHRGAGVVTRAEPVGH